MVPQASDNPVVQEHYAAQVALSTAVLQAVARLGSPRPTDQAALLAQEFSQAAISAAFEYYADVREFAQIGGTYRPPVVAPWDVDSLTAYMDSALSTFEQQYQEAQTGIDAQVDALAAQMVLDAGSREIFAAVENDPKPTRVARVTRPGACSFCLMLAVRGAVYRSENSASFRAHTYPGLCRCDIEPVWGEYEPPAHIRAAQALYSEATADLPRGADRANAFRRAVYAERNTAR